MKEIIKKGSRDRDYRDLHVKFVYMYNTFMIHTIFVSVMSGNLMFIFLLLYNSYISSNKCRYKTKSVFFFLYSKSWTFCGGTTIVSQCWFGYHKEIANHHFSRLSRRSTSVFLLMFFLLLLSYCPLIDSLSAFFYISEYKILKL